MGSTKTGTGGGAGGRILWLEKVGGGIYGVYFLGGREAREHHDYVINDYVIKCVVVFTSTILFTQIKGIQDDNIS